MNASVVSLLLLAAACGGQTPTSPSPVVSSLTISGRVTAAATGGALVGAIVTVNGKPASTDVSGRYYAVVFGPAPVYPISLDVRLNGFQNQHRQLTNALDSTDVALVSAGTPVAVAGQWTATLVVSPACSSQFPAGARQRVYDVTITQEATQAILTFRSPTLERGQNNVLGLAMNDRLSFVIASDTSGPDQFLWAYFVDHVSATEEVALSVSGSAPAASTGFTVPLDGHIQYRKGSEYLDCIAPNHALQFQTR